MLPTEIAGAVRAGTLTPSAAVQMLVDGGEDRRIARNFVWEALGGGGTVEIDAEGRKRYGHSGVLVSDVQAAMVK